MVLYIEKDTNIDEYFLIVNNLGINHSGIQITLEEFGRLLISCSDGFWLEDGNVFKCLVCDHVIEAYNKIVKGREINGR